MESLSDDNQADIIEAFNSTSKYLDDLLNIYNPYFEGMVNQVYPPELQLNKTNASDTKPPFWVYISLFIIVSTKSYDKSNDFDFDRVNFHFLDGDVPRHPFYWVNITCRFARVYSYVPDFNVRNRS